MISAYVICFNNEVLIERCLRSLAFADEVVLVDSGSTDQTLALAANVANQCKIALRIIQRPWQNFSDQRNFAMSQCKGPWILGVDSDEAVSAELADKIRIIAKQHSEKQPPAITCYRIRRLNYFLGRPIRIDAGPDSWMERLLWKEAGSYVGAIHETILLRCGQIECLSEPIFHDPLRDITSFVERHNKYSQLEAESKYREGKRTSLPHAIFTFISTFLRFFVAKKWFIDGKQGFIMACLEGYNRTLIHLKLWAIQDGAPERIETLLKKSC